MLLVRWLICAWSVINRACTDFLLSLTFITLEIITSLFNHCLFSAMFSNIVGSNQSSPSRKYIKSPLLNSIPLFLGCDGPPLFLGNLYIFKFSASVCCTISQVQSLE